MTTFETDAIAAADDFRRGQLRFGFPFGARCCNVAPRAKLAPR